MSQIFSKFGFIHRRLWDRDGTYRLALLFGPAPLIGCGVAVGIWFIVRALPTSPVQLPEWAKIPRPTDRWSTTGEVQTTAPARLLPPKDAHGGLTGYEQGWQATIHAVDVTPTWTTEIKQIALSGFFIEGSTLELEPIIAAGPKNTRFIGAGSGFLAVRTPGVYTLSLRFEKPLGQVTDCLTRLSLGPRKIVANFDIATPGNVSKTFDAARFDLQPGLYPIGWAFGCWKDQEVIGPARITVLIGHPGEQAPQPARPDDIVRTERIK
jgi:hypothetical protein